MMRLSKTKPYPVSSIEHDEVQRVARQLSLDDGQGVTGCHGFQQRSLRQLVHVSQLRVKPGAEVSWVIAKGKHSTLPSGYTHKLFPAALQRGISFKGEPNPKKRHRLY